jgi:hypothetical protein
MAEPAGYSTIDAPNKGSTLGVERGRTRAAPYRQGWASTQIIDDRYFPWVERKALVLRQVVSDLKFPKARKHYLCKWLRTAPQDQRPDHLQPPQRAVVHLVVELRLRKRINFDAFGALTDYGR